jgi:hypothetical protein
LLRGGKASCEKQGEEGPFHDFVTIAL